MPVEVDPAPLLQSSMHIVATVEVRYHRPKILIREHLGHYSSGPRAGVREVPHIWSRETPKVTIPPVLSPPRLIPMHIRTPSDLVPQPFILPLSHLRHCTEQL